MASLKLILAELAKQYGDPDKVASRLGDWLPAIADHPVELFECLEAAQLQAEQDTRPALLLMQEHWIRRRDSWREPILATLAALPDLELEVFLRLMALWQDCTIR